MAKSPEYHLDILGKEIRKGSFVVTSSWNGGLDVCVVDSLSPKMLRVRRVSSKSGKNKYPHDVAVVENEDVTMYILRSAI